MKHTHGLLTLVSAVVLLSTAATCPGSVDAHTGRVQIAVARWELPATLVIPWWSAIETTFLHDEMIDALVRTDALDVVERTRLDKIRAEYGLTKDGVTDPNEAAKLGKMAGATYFVLGTVAAVELERSAQPLPYTNRAESRVHGRIQINFRVVDVESSRVVTSGTEDTVDEIRGVDGPDGPQNPRQQDAIKELWERLRRRCAANIALQVADALVPITLVSVTGSEVELSRGASTGVREGYLFDVFASGEPLKDPDTGRIVDQRQQKVGQIEVTHVDPGKASGRVTNKTGEIKVGATCRLVPPPAPAPAAGRPDPLQGRW